MELSLVATLIESYKERAKVFDNFRILIKPIRNVLKEGSVYTDEFQALIFEKRPFRRSYGFLPAVERLIELNEGLISYRSETGLDMESSLKESISHTPENNVVMQAYSKTAELLKKEQYYLVNLLKPTLVEIHNRGKYKESWKKALVSFENFMLLFNAELKRFEILLNELRIREFLKQGLEVLESKRNTIVGFYVEGMAARNFAYLTSLLNNAENRRWFGSEEVNFMQRLADAILSENAEMINSLLKTRIFVQIFKAEHYINFFRSVLESLREKSAAEIVPEQLERSLAAEAEALGQLREAAEQYQAPEIVRDIVKEAKKIEEVVPEVRKFKKSRLRRLRARFKVARRKYKSKKEVVDQSLRVLRHSVSARTKINNMINSLIMRRCTNILSELKKISENIKEKRKRFPSFAQQLDNLEAIVNDMISDIESTTAIIRDSTRLRVIAAQRQASSIFSNLWSQLRSGAISIYKFANELQSLISKRTEQLESALRNLGKPTISRRRLLKLGAAAGVAAAAGGAALWMTRKKEEISVKSRGTGIELPFVEPNFGPVTIPEVNKTIYTEGRYLNLKYIIVIPHSTELNALEAARAVARGPITYVTGNNDRNLILRNNGQLFQIDPNNAFCTPGLVTCFNRLNGEWNSLSQESKNYVLQSIQKFTDEVSRRIFWGKMVLALHQNTQNNFGIASYRNEPRFAIFAEEVFINPNERNDDFAYVNTMGWFEALKKEGWNVVLQKNDRSINDGSISYAATWKNAPYVNIEVQVGDAQKQARMIETLNNLIEKYPQLATDMNFIPVAANINKDLKLKLKKLYCDLRNSYPVKDNEYVIITFGDSQKLFLISGNSNDITVHKEYNVSTGKGGFGAERLQGKTPSGVMRIGVKAGDNAAIGSVFQSLRFTGRVVPISYNRNDSSHPFMTTRIMELVGVEEQNRHFNTIRIHGTNKEGLIGQPDPSGCVRMRNNEVIELYDLVPAGTYVYIVPESPRYPESKGKIFLTVDDGPTQYMENFLTYFKSNGINAIFFCVGQNLRVYSSSVVRAIREGFIIANHSYSHPQFSKISEVEAFSEIKRTDDIIEELYREAGVERKIKLFRFPYGDSGGLTKSSIYKKMLAELGYQTWFWTRDPLDYKKPVVTQVLNELSNLNNGEIILLHDRGYTCTELLDPICNCIRDQGLITAYPVLNQVSSQSTPFGILNILVIGSDLGTGHQGERGDALVFMQTNTVEKTIKILTIPRDMYVSIRGRKTKINHALAYGGWQLQKATVEEFIGVKADKVFFIDITNLRDLVYTIRQEIGSFQFIRDVHAKVGFREAAELMGSGEFGWNAVNIMVRNRNMPDSSLGRAKNHAKILGACISLLKDYYNDPQKSRLFRKDMVSRLLSLVRYSNLTPEEVNLIVREWSSNEYRIELYCIPCKPQNIDGVFYWIPEIILGIGSYFNKVIHYRKSIIA